MADRGGHRVSLGSVRDFDIELVLAVRQDDVDAVREMLDLGANVNARDAVRCLCLRVCLSLACVLCMCSYYCT
jgi:hypothetical protein